jgi:hypothetical protein
MHLVVPFAAPLGDDGRDALRRLPLPGLCALLGAFAADARDDGDETSFTPPHERVVAKAVGWEGEDGRWPFAAWQAQLDGIAPGALAWGRVTPVHWHVGSDHVRVVDADRLELDEGDGRSLLAAVEPLFTSEGFTVRYGAPTRWYVAHESLARLRCASLDRVAGRALDRWLPIDDPDARLVRRLQNEVQMLLYTHPINDARSARGQLPVNSFWLSGCGVAQPLRAPPPQVDVRLRGPALEADWEAWTRAWAALDAGPIDALRDAARRGEESALTLCGERSAACFRAGGRSSIGRRVRALLGRAPAPQATLETL